MWSFSSLSRPPTLKPLSSQQSRISVAIAVAISKYHKSSIHFLNPKFNAADLVQVFTSTIIPAILAAHDSLDGVRIIMDNDGRHNAPVFVDFMKRIGLSVIRPWPAKSPDLNPIENVFSFLKSYVQGKCPTTERKLRYRIRRGWAKVSPTFLAHLLDSIPDRLSQVISLNGEKVAY